MKKTLKFDDIHLFIERAVPPIAALTQSGLPFGDVSENDYFYKWVKYCYDNGILKETNESSFSPAAQMSRAMLVTALYRHEGEPQSLFSAGFGEVIPGSYYKKEVNWAAEKGIINVYDAGHFGPDRAMTREDLAKILKAYNDYKDYVSQPSKALSIYPDGEDVSDYAKDTLAWAIRQGIITGKEQGLYARLDAHETASRAQCAAMLQRFLENKTNQTDSESFDSSSSRIELSLPELEAAKALTNLVKTELLASS